MDMFDFNQVINLLKVEPGHGLIQSLLLLMIWISSRGIKKEIADVKQALSKSEDHSETKFEKIENRLAVLESNLGGK